MAQLDIYTFKKCFVVFYFISIVARENVTGRGTFFNGRSRFGWIGSPFGPNRPDMMGLMGDHWIKQRVDNFDPNNNATWKNLYLVNQGFYKPGGPIFLMFRGESAVSKSFMFAGSWVHFAKQYNAMLFQLEHRYYGQSFPTKDMSTPNMKYLTVENALADAANFIQKMNKAYNFTSTQKWIAFGGSYGGALVVWMRVRYPNLVYGGVSSSGPIAPVVNFKKYMSAVTHGYKLTSHQCIKDIKLGFQQIMQRANGTNLSEKTKLATELKLCQSFKKKRTKDDISNLIYTLAGFYAYVCQYNEDNTSDNNVTIPAVCSAITSQKNATPIASVKTFLNMYLNEVGDSCVGFTYKPMIQQLRQTSLTSENVIYGDRQWMYQQCAQLGYFQTSDSHHEVFGHNYPLKFFIKQCIDTFKPNFKPITKINLPYGGLKPPTNNIICIQGSIDPWRELGYTRNSTPGIMSLYIKGTAHVADMYEPATGDPAELFQARVIISNYIGRLLDTTAKSSPIFFDSSLVSSSSSSKKNATKKAANGKPSLMSNSTAMSSAAVVITGTGNSSMFASSKSTIIKLSAQELNINTTTPITPINGTSPSSSSSSSSGSSSSGSGSSSSGSGSSSSGSGSSSSTTNSKPQANINKGAGAPTNQPPPNHPPHTHKHRNRRYRNHRPHGGIRPVGDARKSHQSSASSSSPSGSKSSSTARSSSNGSKGSSGVSSSRFGSWLQ